MASKGGLAIVPLEDFNASMNILVYGDPGVGKTVLGGSTPKACFLAAEPGTIAAKRQGSKAQLAKIDTWDDAMAALKTDWSAFDWLIVDGLTTLQEKALRWILDRAVADNSNRDPDIPAIQDHQKWQNMFKRWVTEMVDLPVNVLFTAQTMRKEDEDGEDIVMPSIQGKNYQISNYICGLMDVVGYMAVRNIRNEDKSVTQVRRVLWSKRSPYYAKDRFAALGKTMDDPTMTRIIEAIQNSVEEIPAIKPKRRSTSA